MAEPSIPLLKSAALSLGNRLTSSKIHAIVAQASLKNERKFAYVRVIVLVISSVLDVLVFFFPQQLMNQPSVSPTVAIISGGATIIAIGFLLALLRPQAWRYSDMLQTAIPLFDGLILGLFTVNIWRVLGDSQPDIITNIAAFCCVLAVSGGIRIRERASILTTALALGNFTLAAVLFKLSPVVTLFALFTILGTGLLGMLIADIVRRQGKSEVGRQLMRQFLPEVVVEAAFEHPRQLLEEPRKCEVTIMVTDLRGFTHYSEKLEPLAVLEFLSNVQGALSAIVEQHGGWVDKFMGDGMLAVFGAPKALDHHAEQALRAAQIILKENSRWSPLPIGIGLHTGVIVAGCLGSGGHLEFTVIGDTVNVAARLEALTKTVDSPLLVSATTQHQIPNAPLTSLGMIPIRGRDHQIEVFTLL